MGVVDDRDISQREAVHPGQVANRCVECPECFMVREVSNVLTDVRLSVHDQRDRILEIGAERKDRPVRGKDGHCAWSQAARPPHHHRPDRTGPHDGIIHAPRDRPLANQERIRNAGQSPSRIVVSKMSAISSHLDWPVNSAIARAYFFIVGTRESPFL